MINYFYAVSGAGKSALASAMLVQFLENKAVSHLDEKGYFEFLKIPPKVRLRMCHSRIKRLENLTGQPFEYPTHVVQSNEGIWTTKHGEFICSYDLAGDKIGFYDEDYETDCPPPCSLVRWDETQKEASGRDSSSMSPRVSALLQLHRKWGLDILCFTQRATILDLNIRDNARIFEIESMQHKLDKYGFIRSTTWKLKYFEKLKDLEHYLATNEKTYKHTSYTFNGNIFKHFDSNEGEEYFIDLATKRGINTKIKDIDRSSISKIQEYIKNNPYTPPVNYRKTTASQQRKKEEKKKGDKNANS